MKRILLLGSPAASRFIGIPIARCTTSSWRRNVAPTRFCGQRTQVDPSPGGELHHPSRLSISIGETEAETYFVRDLLLPELDTEIGKTRRLFEALPDGKSDFKPYEKSMTLGRLAGHTTDLFRLIAFTLTMSELDMAVAWQPYTKALKGRNARTLREQRR